MSFININRIYTADPGDIWTPKSAFMLSDPFAIVLNIHADASLVREGLLFDAVFQILGACRRNAKQADSRHRFSHFRSHSTGHAHATRHKRREARVALPTFSHRHEFPDRLLGPQQDPHGFPWWTILNGNVVTSPSRDVVWTGISFQWGTNFAIWWSWSQYLQAVMHIGNAKQGVFYAQGTVSVQGSDLFANSDQFWFKVR